MARGDVYPKNPIVIKKDWQKSIDSGSGFMLREQTEFDKLFQELEFSNLYQERLKEALKDWGKESKSEAYVAKLYRIRQSFTYPPTGKSYQEGQTDDLSDWHKDDIGAALGSLIDEIVAAERVATPALSKGSPEQGRRVEGSQPITTLAKGTPEETTEE